MKKLVFTWDPAKAAINERKHGVSFEEARTSFYDDNARLEHDPDHSDDEDRFVLLGLSSQVANNSCEYSWSAIVTVLMMARFV